MTPQRVRGGGGGGLLSCDDPLTPMNVPHLSGPSTKAQILIFLGTSAALESDEAK